MDQKKNLHNEIAVVAYTLFENSGRLHGYDLDNWLEAEKMVMAAYADAMAGKAKKPSKAKTKKEKPKE
jgi:ribosomal protein L12E/L44/L45/RPP1/RPP2